MNTLHLSRSLFWDVDYESLDEQKHRRLIIERTIVFGDINDVSSIIHYYGLKTIKEEIVLAGDIDNKTLAWLNIFLNIPKEKFKCYEKRQLNPAP